MKVNEEYFSHAALDQRLRSCFNPEGTALHRNKCSKSSVQLSTRHCLRKKSELLFVSVFHCLSLSHFSCLFSPSSPSSTCVHSFHIKLVLVSS